MQLLPLHKVLLILLGVSAVAAASSPPLTNLYLNHNNLPHVIKRFFDAVHNNDVAYLSCSDADNALPFVPDHRISGVLISIVLGHLQMTRFFVKDIEQRDHFLDFLRSRPKHIAFVLNEIQDFASAKIDRLSRILAAKYVLAGRFSRQHPASGQQSQLHQRKRYNEKPEVMWLSCVRLLRHVKSHESRQDIVAALSTEMLPGLMHAVDMTKVIAQQHIQNVFKLKQLNHQKDLPKQLADFALLNSLDEHKLDQARYLLHHLGANPAAAFEFAIANDDFAMLQRLGALVNVQNGYPLLATGSLGNRDAIHILKDAATDMQNAAPNPVLWNDCDGEEVEALRQRCATSCDEEQLKALMDLVEHIPFQNCICSSIGLTSAFKSFRLAATPALCLYFAFGENNVGVIQHLMHTINADDATRSFFASFIDYITEIIPARTLRLPEGFQAFMKNAVDLPFPSSPIQLRSDSSTAQMSSPEPLQQQQAIPHDLGLGSFVAGLQTKCASAQPDQVKEIMRSDGRSLSLLKELGNILLKLGSMQKLQSTTSQMLCLFSALSKGNFAFAVGLLSRINDKGPSLRKFFVLLHLLNQMHQDARDENTASPTLAAVGDSLSQFLAIPIFDQNISVRVSSIPFPIDGTAVGTKSSDIDQPKLDEAISNFRDNEAEELESAIVNADFTELQRLLHLGFNPNARNGHPLVVAASSGNRKAIPMLVAAGGNINQAVPNPLGIALLHRNDAMVELLRNDYRGDDVKALQHMCAAANDENQVAVLMDLIEHRPFQKIICSSIGLASDLYSFRLAATRSFCLYSAIPQKNGLVIQQLLHVINANVASRSFFASFIIQMSLHTPDQRLKLPENMSSVLSTSVNYQFDSPVIRLRHPSFLPEDNYKSKTPKERIVQDLGFVGRVRYLHSRCANTVEGDQLDTLIHSLHQSSTHNAVFNKIPWQFDAIHGLKSAITKMLCLFSALTAENDAVVQRVLGRINGAERSTRSCAVLFHLCSQMINEATAENNSKLDSLKSVMDFLSMSVEIPSIRNHIGVRTAALLPNGFKGRDVGPQPQSSRG